MSVSSAPWDRHNAGMRVTTRSQNSPDDTSQETVKREEGGSGAEPGETPPVAVPPVIPLPEDRAAALDELCRSLDGSDERVSRSITRIRLEKGLPWDTDPRVVADALVRAGHLPEVVRTITWDWALWTCGSEDSWPWMAQDLARARDLLKDSTSATRVLRALEHFPAVPQSYGAGAGAGCRGTLRGQPGAGPEASRRLP